METNPELELAYDFLENTGLNVFLTGKAGTGKTTFLRRLKERTPKRMIVVAPTGVAAINAGGVTIHSFFQLPFGPYIPGLSEAVGGEGKKSKINKFSREKINVIKSIDLLVIDEISMVRADLLDAVDDVLRRYRDRSRPFGGVQLLMIGDLQQLAPVVKEDEWALLKEHYPSIFFFSSKALADTRFVPIELKRVYRQQESFFLELLNQIRENKITANVLNKLNERYVAGFDSGSEEYIVLTTHNFQAKQINESKLYALETETYSFKAEIKGEFPVYAYPTDENLALKKGAQVMFVRNDASPEKRYYNGKIAIVTEINRNLIRVKGKEDGAFIDVERVEWCNTKYSVDPDTKEITEIVEGSFSQFPLKAAWAITIHKSQGLTFDKVIIDSGAAFAHGQVYVALSRCKTFEGLILRTPVNVRSLVNDTTIDRFMTELKEHQPGSQLLKEARREYYKELLLEQFDYGTLQRRLRYLFFLLDDNLGRFYPDFVAKYRDANERFAVELYQVAERFKGQLKRLLEGETGAESRKILEERIVKGKIYFEESTEKILGTLLLLPLPEIDNKEVRKSIDKALKNLQEELNIKTDTLRSISDGFDIKCYLIAKAKARIEVPQRKQKSKKADEKQEVTRDILHPTLYEEIQIWRKGEADRLKLPVYTVLHQKALLGIANVLPTNSKELLSIPGIGKKVIERYGAVLLDLVDRYRFQGDKK